jgi:E3 ubiquitin-protein ligase SHPRH
MEKIGDKARKQSFAIIPELKARQQRGIETKSIVERVESLYDTLNDQANIIDDWREAVIQLLLKPLIDEEDTVETTGEEFDNSTKIQDHIMVYIQALRTVIADRQDAVLGQLHDLVRHEAKVALESALEGEGPAPQKLLELFSIREKVKPGPQYGSLRSAISDLRAAASKVGRFGDGANNRHRLEHEIINLQMQGIQADLTKQNKVMLEMEKEVERFTGAMNARVGYYKQLQAISDSVDVYAGDKGPETMKALVAKEEKLGEAVSRSEAKHRYCKVLFSSTLCQELMN